MRVLRTLAVLGVVLTACNNSADSDNGTATGGQGAAGTPAAGSGSGGAPGAAGKAPAGAGAGAGSTTAGSGGAGAGGAAGHAGTTTNAGAASGTGGTPSNAGTTSSAGTNAGGTPGGGRGGASAGVGGAGTTSGGNGTGGRGSAGKAGSGGGAGAGGNITVWLAGDSTMANGETPCPVGWGKVFDALFDDRVTVTNSAVGGRSVRTWLYSVQKTMDASSGECVRDLDQNGKPVLQSRWTTMLNGMKAGDYLMIQFGINDGDPNCDRHVGLDAFEEEYGMMAQAAKDRGAQPVFITPVSAISCKGSSAQGTRGDFVTTTIDAGQAFDVPVIDLHASSVALYTSLGFCPVPGGDVSATTTGPVGDFFCDDHTHFDTPGAQQIAELVAGAIEAQKLPLAAYLK